MAGETNRCIFCEPLADTIRSNIVSSSRHFFAIYDGFPVTKPHFLIIPKTHVSHYGALPGNLSQELAGFLDHIQKESGILTPLLFEHGVIGQTVRHAHLHFMPPVISPADVADRANVKGERIAVTDIDGLRGLSDYLFLQRADAKLALRPSHAVAPGILTNTIAAILGAPYPASRRQPAMHAIVKRYAMKPYAH